MTGERKPDADDVALSALLDGELPAAERERLRRRLGREPALARRLDALRGADAIVRSAYAGIVDEPLPDRVLQLLSADNEGKDDGANTVDFASRARARRAATRFLSLPVAIAAGIALAVGAVSSFLALSQMQPRGATEIIAGAGIVEPGSELYEVLQSGESAQTHALDSQTTALPRMSFLAQSGNYCRQVDITAARGTSHIIACRRATDWQLELVSFTATRRMEADGRFRPAASGTPAVIEAGIDVMIDGEPLGRDAEKDALARDWATPPAP